MNKSLRVIGLIALGNLIGACASTDGQHSNMRGSVATKINDNTGIACLGNNEVKEGDTLAIFKNECTTPTRASLEGGGTPVCKKVSVGAATVSKLLNEHYSEFKLDSSTHFEEGYVLEARN